MPPKIVSKDSTYVSPLQQLQTKNQPSNKRIRVSRACDTCRKRKVKCDGKQPCIHCTVYSYECSYNHLRPTSNQKKQRKDSVPQAGTTNNNVLASQSGSLASVPLTTSTSAPVHSSVPVQNAPLTSRPVQSKSKTTEALVKALFPELAIDSDFNSDLFIEIFEKNKKEGVIDLNATLEEYNSKRALNIVSPSTHHQQSSSSRPHDPVEIKIILPPREIALKLIYKTWNDSCIVFRFYHRPSFIKDFNSLYETNPMDYSNHQNKMLPLIYSVIAVGALFSKGDNVIDNQYLQDEGYRYFIAARKLVDITNSTDLESIQTIFMLTLFLQCSARLSTCYSYIGIALRSALRQGLHRKLETPCDPIKSECKKRLFWTIYKLEIYVNSILGLPNSIDEEDIDAEFPQDIDDINIELNDIKPQQSGKLSSCGINNSHTKLILILNHIIKKLYKTSNPIFVIPQETIQNLENQLKIWTLELPSQLKITNTFEGDSKIPVEYLKANKILHLDYLHVQIMLYRPFIHYVKMAKQSHASEDDASRSYQYQLGLKCFDISKEIISLAKKMIEQKLLNGNYWFSVYTIFFAVACLIYYYLEIDSSNKEINRIIEIGKGILSGLKQKSASAERIYNLLNHMFENYDRDSLKFSKLQKSVTTPQSSVSNKKRVPQSGPFTGPHQPPLNTYKSPNNTPNVNTAATYTTESIDNPPLNQAVTKTNPLPATVSSVDNPLSQQHQQQSEPQDQQQQSSSNSFFPGLDDFDLQIFGKFLPNYMIENTLMNQSNNTSTQSNNLYGIDGLSESPNDDLYLGNVGSAHGGGGSSIDGKTEEGDAEFDWNRFIDKGDLISFDV